MDKNNGPCLGTVIFVFEYWVIIYTDFGDEKHKGASSGTILK